jgi:hypothetical protein
MVSDIDLTPEAVERLADRMDFHAMQQIEYDCANTLRALSARLSEVEAERDRVADINRSLCDSHNALLVDGSKWQARAEAAEAKLAKAVDALRVLRDQHGMLTARATLAEIGEGHD